MDACLGRMQEAIVSGGVDDPEVFVAGGDLQNFLRRRKLNQRCVAHLGAYTDDVVGVVLHHASGLLGEAAGCGQQQREREYKSLVFIGHLSLFEIGDLG